MLQKILNQILMILNTTLFFCLSLAACVSFAKTISPLERVLHSEQQTQGASLTATVQMSVNHDTSQRDLKFRMWEMGHDKAVVKILQPQKDKGTATLRVQFDLWQYLPNVERVVRIPPSMMLQSWMGSDFTNDDLVKASSLSRDYTHKIAGEEKVNGTETTIVVCDPKPDAPVVWGKIKLYLRADDVPLRQEFFNEHGELIKRLEGSEIKTVGKHTLPTKLVMTTLSKKDQSTTMEMSNIKFDEKLSDGIFTQESMRKPATLE